MTLIKKFNEGTDELLNCFQIHSEFVKQDLNFASETFNQNQSTLQRLLST